MDGGQVSTPREREPWPSNGTLARERRTALGMRHFVLVRFIDYGFVGLWHCHDGQVRDGYASADEAREWAERTMGKSETVGTHQTQWHIVQLPA